MPNGNSERQDIEWRKCKKSLLYYLTNYVYIQDAVNQRVSHWLVHDHLLQLINPIQVWSERTPHQPLYIIIFKSRQVYTTTTVSAVINWLCTFFESTRALASSQKEDDAFEILNKCRFVNNNHPDFLKLILSPDQSGLLGFPATQSRIRALPATAGAGRSTDSTIVFCDEWEYHSEAERNFGAAKPTIDKGGIFIGVSTIDKTNIDSFPKRIWRGARDGSNNFLPIFWDYYVVPGRTDETWAEDTKGMPDWQREAEYPRNEEEAMSAPKTICFFNRDVLTDMMRDAREPLETRYGGLVRVYQKSLAERRYVFAIDPSEGQEDPTAGVISDLATGMDVVAIHGKMSVDQQARVYYELYEEYNRPFTGIERNASGVLLIDKLEQMGVDNWYYQDAARKKKGWYTSGSGYGGGSRPVMLQDLSETISDRQLIIPMRDALSEFTTFSWIDGKPQAIRGAHDDWVMSHAILCQLRKSYRPVGSVKISSFRYRESV